MLKYVYLTTKLRIALVLHPTFYYIIIWGMNGNSFVAPNNIIEHITNNVNLTQKTGKVYYNNII